MKQFLTENSIRSAKYEENHHFKHKRRVAMGIRNQINCHYRNGKSFIVEKLNKIESQNHLKWKMMKNLQKQ
ncbi:hypothetical protein SNEBB_010046 [Seison nebaliae]|nr:hypothetical protein SNEBB_010046 [Seison nebaliae]